MIGGSEYYLNHKPDALFIDSRVVQVSQTAYVFDMQQFKDVVNAHAGFQVRYFRIHHIAGVAAVPLREIKQLRIIALKRVIIIRQVAV